MEIHWKAPLQVKGFLKIVEIVIALLALSLAASFSPSYTVTCSSWSPEGSTTNGTATIRADLKYPYNSLALTISVNGKDSNSSKHDVDEGFKSAGEFFVAWGSLTLFYGVIAILVYMLTTANSKFEWFVDYLILSDLICHVMWVLCWFIASVEWAVAQSQMTPYVKDYLTNYVWKKNCLDATSPRFEHNSFAQAAIADVFGWTSIIIWGVNIFWVVADTSFYIRWRANRSGNYQNL